MAVHFIHVNVLEIATFEVTELCSQPNEKLFSFGKFSNTEFSNYVVWDYFYPYSYFAQGKDFAPVIGIGKTEDFDTIYKSL